MENKAIDLHVEKIVIDAIHALGCDVEAILPEDRVGEELGIDSSEIVELEKILRGQLGEAGRTLSLRGAETVLAIMQRVQACQGNGQ